MLITVHSSRAKTRTKSQSWEYKGYELRSCVMLLRQSMNLRKC